MLTPSSMVDIWAAINRTLLSPPYSISINIICNRKFTASNYMFFYKTNNKKPKHKAAIKKANMNILHRCFSNNQEDPIELQ